VLRLTCVLAALAGLFAVATPEPRESHWATVRGRVLWPNDTAIPKPEVIDVTTDKAACCKDGRLVSTALVINPKSRGVKNVIVWLRPDSEDRKDTFPKDRIHPDLAKPKPVKHVVAMPRCQYEPRVLAARGGERLEFKNDSDIPHLVNVASDAPEVGRAITVPKDDIIYTLDPLVAQLTPLTFRCDVHPWMAGRLRVFDHPYFAVTDKDGRFEMPLVPTGEWRVVYWHEKGFHKGADGRLGFPLKVGGGPKLELKDVELVLPK
jgi:hypothetical protein